MIINRLKENSTYFGLAVLAILAIRIFMADVDVGAAVLEADNIYQMLLGLGLVATPEVKRGNS